MEPAGSETDEGSSEDEGDEDEEAGEGEVEGEEQQDDEGNVEGQQGGGVSDEAELDPQRLLRDHPGLRHACSCVSVTCL